MGSGSGPWDEGELKAEATAMTEAVLEAAQTDLEVARPATIVRVELVAVAVIDDEEVLERL